MNFSIGSATTRLRIPSYTGQAVAHSSTGFPTSSGTGCRSVMRSSSLVFTEDETHSLLIHGFARASNPRLQRTPLRAPLSRKSFGGTCSRSAQDAATREL